MDSFLLELWRDVSVVKEFRTDYDSNYQIDRLKKTEWSEEFERLIRNRLIMGALRYGRLHENNKPIYDRIESVLKRINQYKLNHNKELLIDIANLCLCEFEEGGGTFKAHDDGEHVSIKV
jgi:hypothetical protein